MLLTEYPDKIKLVNKQKYIFAQPKLNGWRSMANTLSGQVFIRRKKDNSLQEIKLTHITKQLLSQPDLPEWIDGELYLHGSTLGQIQSMIRKQNEEIKFNCFDVISSDPFTKRLKIRDNIEVIELVETIKILPSDVITVYRDFLSRGYEGMIIRIDGMPYQQFRTEQVIKLKPEIV